MNILIINGSPKGARSNTYRLTNAFVDGIAFGEKNGGHDAPAVQTLEISSLNIKPCLGCFACWNKAPGRCCINDDMRIVLEKLLWADITVWSFPLYFFSVPGQLKNLIDRQLPMYLPFMNAQTKSGGHPPRYDMSGKKAVVISTCGFYTTDGNYDSVISLLDHYYGKNGYTALFCGQGELFHVKELSKRTDEYLACVRKAGLEYAQGGITQTTLDELSQNLYPRDVFEAMADASWGISENGEREDDSLIFTRQMAALYNKDAYPGHDIIVEMNYTDIEKTYYVILTKDGSQVAQDFSGAYTTQINTPYTVWKAIAAGEMQGEEALMKHLYQVQGDFDLMIHWDDYFGIEKAGLEKKRSPGKTNMSILLAPWIVFWIVAPLNSFWGSLVSLAVCVLVPLIFFQNKKTIYDSGTIPAVGCCCIALLTGIPSLWVLPLSYLIFGLMWSISCFAKIPLTAHYSMNNYNGEAALSNPIFMKTNRILTAAWGVLYLCISIGTYFIMQTSISSYTGAINSVLPALMGIFTAWFQKWYPRHVARGK